MIFQKAPVTIVAADAISSELYARTINSNEALQVHIPDISHRKETECGAPHSFHETI